ncbi:MAG: hypothetical protein R3F04_07715 [Lysobacteraceae bacterium]
MAKQDLALFFCRRVKRLSCLALLVAAFPFSVSAKLPPAKLADLVGFSNFIFVGRIYSRGDDAVLRGSFNSWGRLQIEVERPICGQFFKEEWPDGRVEVLYPINPMERPSFELGTRYVFFWKDGYSGPQLAPSFYGAARIEDELVYMQLVEDIARKIPLNELEGMIDCSSATGSNELPATPTLP